LPSGEKRLGRPSSILLFTSRASPARVVTTPGLHFYPTVTVDSLGRVNVFFYDRRENRGTSITNLYFAQSSDGGASFDPNIRVTDTPSLWTIEADTPNYGDYINSLSVGTKACVAYADGRDGDPDAYFACVDL